MIRGFIVNAGNRRGVMTGDATMYNNETRENIKKQFFEMYKGKVLSKIRVH
jgi:hypothetical protein